MTAHSVSLLPRAVIVLFSCPFFLRPPLVFPHSYWNGSAGHSKFMGRVRPGSGLMGGLRHGLGHGSRTCGRLWILLRAACTKHLRHKGYSVGYSDPSLLGLDHDILHCSACRVDGLAVPAASCCMMPHPPSSVTENLDPIPRRAYPALLPPQATRAPSRRRTQGTHHTPA